MRMIQRINCGKQSKTRTGISGQRKSYWIGMVENSYSIRFETGFVRGRFPNNPYTALLGKSIYLTCTYWFWHDGRTTI